jgi:hypothetical protein
MRMRLLRICIQLAVSFGVISLGVLIAMHGGYTLATGDRYNFRPHHIELGVFVSLVGLALLAELLWKSLGYRKPSNRVPPA